MTKDERAHFTSGMVAVLGLLKSKPPEVSFDEQIRTLEKVVMVLADKWNLNTAEYKLLDASWQAEVKATFGKPETGN